MASKLSIKREIRDLKSRIKYLESQLEHEEIRNLGIWLPKEGEIYFYVNENGGVSNLVFENDCIDSDSLDSFNYWKSEEMAESVGNNVKLYWLLVHLRNSICPDYKPSYEHTSFYPVYSSVTSSWEVCEGKGDSFQIGVAFDTKSNANKAAKLLNKVGIVPM